MGEICVIAGISCTEHFNGTLGKITKDKKCHVHAPLSKSVLCHMTPDFWFGRKEIKNLTICISRQIPLGWVRK